jgi:hypothetical protein
MNMANATTGVAETCGFAGNSNIYSLGIRLGMYFQWATSFISNQFYEQPSEHRELADATLLFIFALLINLLLAKSQAAAPYSIEIFIIFIFFGGYIVIWGFPLNERQQRESKRKAILWALEL